MCSGSSTSAIKASVNAPSNQQHHPSYDNAACAGSDISTACHPPSLYEESLTSTLTSMVGRDQEATPKPDARIQSNMICILLASTPSMPPRWSMTDPSGRPLFADCQRSNPSMALKSSKSRYVYIHGNDRVTQLYVISGHASPVFHADFFPRLVKYDVTSQPVSEILTSSECYPELLNVCKP